MVGVYKPVENNKMTKCAGSDSALGDLGAPLRVDIQASVGIYQLKYQYGRSACMENIDIHFIGMPI